MCHTRGRGPVGGAHGEQDLLAGGARRVVVFAHELRDEGGVVADQAGEHARVEDRVRGGAVADARAGDACRGGLRRGLGAGFRGAGFRCAGAGVGRCRRGGGREVALQHRTQGLDLHRLDEVVVHAGVETAPVFAAQGVGGDRDDGQAPARVLLRADACGQRVAVHVGHVEVGQQQVVGAFAPARERLLAVLGQLAGQPEQTELAGDDLAVDVVVLGDEDACGRHARIEPGDCGRAAALRRPARPFGGVAPAGDGHRADQLVAVHAFAVEREQAGALLACLAARAMQDEQDAGAARRGKLLPARVCRRRQRPVDEQHGLVPGRGEELQRLLAAGRALHARAGVREVAAPVGDQARVGDRQDAQHAGERLRSRVLVRAHGLERQRQGEAGARAGAAVDRDLAAEQVGQAAADRQPEAGAAEASGRGGLGLGEGLEQALDHLRAHADAVVAHRERQAAIRAAAGAEVDPAAATLAGGELDRVAGEVGEDLLYAQPVGQHLPGEVGVDEDLEGDAALLRHRLQGVADALDELDQAGRVQVELEVAGLDLGEVEDVVDEMEQGRRGVAHDIDHLGLLVVQPAVGEHVDQAGHAVHGGADLVAHGGEEVALGAVGGLGGGERLAQLARAGLDQVLEALAVVVQLRLHAARGGDVLLDRDVVGGLAGVVVDRDDVGALVVFLAVLVAVVQHAGPRLARGQAAPHVLVGAARRLARLQDARVPAQHLFGLVAALAQEALVHILDVAGEVGDDDALRALLDRAGELAQGRLGLLARAHVVNDGEQQGARLVQDGPAVDLDVADGAVGAAVAEVEAKACGFAGRLHLGADALVGEDVDVADAHAPQGRERPAVEGLGGRVGIDELQAVGVHDQHHGVAVAEDRRVARLADVERALGADLQGEVLGEGQQRHQPAVGVAVGAVVPLAVQQAAVAGVVAADHRRRRRAAGDRLADRALDPVRVVGVGEAPLVRALAQHFGGVPAEHPLGLGRPAQDAQVAAPLDDRERAGVDEEVDSGLGRDGRRWQRRGRRGRFTVAAGLGR